MCVLTYVPFTDGFVITSNRDEHINRPRALPPNKLIIKGIENYCPIDPLSNGTWITTTSCFTLVLLNGGFENHQKKDTYRHSRGQVIPEFMQWNNPADFFHEFVFEDIEPFTLLVFTNNQKEYIKEIVWTGQEKHLASYDNQQASIWSSSTLYNQTAREKRRNWFFDFLQQQNDVTTDQLLSFHYEGGKEDPEDSIRLKRSNGIETVNITQIEIYPSVKYVSFNDLITSSNQQIAIL